MKWSTLHYGNSPPADANSATWFSNANPGVNIEEKEEEINTINDPEHINNYNLDHLCIHLIIRGKTEVKVERLNTGCKPPAVNLLC